MSPGYRILTKRKQKSCSTFGSLSGVLEVKYDLNRTSMKKQIKIAKVACIGMWPRMHFLYLQGLYVFWTAGLTTVEQSIGCRVHFIENALFKSYITTGQSPMPSLALDRLSMDKIKINSDGFFSRLLVCKSSNRSRIWNDTSLIIVNCQLDFFFN